MAPIIYEIDPDADTVIVLKNSCTSFAEWDPVQAAKEAEEKARLEELEAIRAAEVAEVLRVVEEAEAEERARLEKEAPTAEAPSPEAAWDGWGFSNSSLPKKKKKKKGKEQSSFVKEPVVDELVWTPIEGPILDEWGSSSISSSKKKKKKKGAIECVPDAIVEEPEVDPWDFGFSTSSKKTQKKNGAIEYVPELVDESQLLVEEPEPVAVEPEPDLDSWPGKPGPEPETEAAEPEPVVPEAVEPEAVAEPEPVVEPEETEEDEIHYYVSSRHLMLASPWFKRALTKDGWIESGRAKIDGRFHITAEDWDAEAFLIILRIFHLRNKQVPRTVTLDMLAKIAILVDYYDCGEALELFTEFWIEHLRKSALPSVYGRDIVLWVWVSWVFDYADEFKRATAVAIKHSSESIRTLELPIPMRVSDEIDSERYQAIDSAMDGVHGLLDKYRKASYVCPTSSEASYQCGSFLFGALTKELDRLGFFTPRPQSPFLGLSFEGLCEKLRTIRPPVLMDRDHYNHYQHYACALGEAVVMVVSMAEAAIIGLDVKSIKKGKGKVKA